MTTQDCNIAVVLGKIILVLAILAIVWMWVAAGRADARPADTFMGRVAAVEHRRGR